MRIGAICETAEGEKRVALVPETVTKLAARKHSVLLERGAGTRAGFTDEAYRSAGATLAERSEVLAQSEVLITVAPASPGDVRALSQGAALLCLQAGTAELVAAARERKLTTIALDLIPRTSLAQSMDVLSSQANLTGYWAVVAAAGRLPKVFPLMMTAAGTVTPARVLVMGAGVAGLQAIGTAKRLGAVVEALDVRRETKEQVESLGGRFLSVEGVEVREGAGGYAAEQSEEYKKRQAELVSAAIARSDVVITTALVPGRKAPLLVTATQLRSMRPGSVVVDLAAEQGGNVEGSKPGVDLVLDGVTVVGARSAASNVAFHASQAFSRNLEQLLGHLTRDGAWQLDLEESIAKGCVVCRSGELVHPQVAKALAPPAESKGAA